MNPFTPLLPLLPAQLAAADPEAHPWVSASAGTGKTQVLTARVLRLLLAGARAERILCITFTKAAAAEMQGRVYNRLAAWVRADDDALDADLRALGLEPDVTARADARRLFATVLDSRGGLRVQTIHGFAQSLLASFPVEAGVVPGFAALDERTAAELQERALNETIAEARSGGDAALLADLEALAVDHGEASLIGMIGRVLRHWEGVRALGSRTGVEPAVRLRLGLPPEGGADAVLGEALADERFPTDELRGFAVALGASPNKTALEAADALRAFLMADGTARAALFDDCRAVFFTTKGERRAKLVPVALLKADPALGETAERLADAVERIEAMRRLLAASACAARVLRVGLEVGARYARMKERLGAIDFDDMIARAAALLGGQGGISWVAYKLDQRIDHVLVDEAQDTNVEQWDIIRGLTEEFFAGIGARPDGDPRTLFVVGDFKQAIYSFQGTNPQLFEEANDHFGLLAADVGRPLVEVALDRSFRSAPAVLDVVDRVIAGLTPQALGMREPIPPHMPSRAGAAGQVTLWPALVDPSQGGDGADESEQGWLGEADIRMAQRLAAQVAAWLDPRDPLWLEARGRPVRAGDILVLVRARGEFVTALVANLHQRGVPVGGVDRMRLVEPLAVQDLMALARFALQPEDDLTLGALLVSPFLGWSQEALFSLAHGRGEQDSLWRRLRERADAGDPQAGEARRWLGEVLGLVDFVPPYEFFETVLSGPLGGRRRLLARLGEEAQGAIDEMLAQALAFEAAHAPSLQGFLAWVEAGDVEVKRDPDLAADAVRIMTVHGAKGLQAPVVVLADAARKPAPDRIDHALIDVPAGGPALPLFHGGSANLAGPLARAIEEERRARREEHWRLLYVALTRAEDMLFVGGALGAKEAAPHPESWHARVAEALAVLGAQSRDDLLWDGEALTWASGTPAPRIATLDPASDVRLLIPSWATALAPEEERPPRPLVPSQVAEDDVAAVPLPRRAVQVAAQRGRLLHKLFERLPAVEPLGRLEAAQAWLARQAADLSEVERDRIAQTALAIIEDPDFAELFGPDALAESPIAALVGETMVTGTVDRLLVRPDRVQVVDFKTGLTVPRSADEVPAYHVRQMAAYVAALRQAFPDRPVEAALLYTEAATLIPLPDRLLAAVRLGAAEPAPVATVAR